MLNVDERVTSQAQISLEDRPIDQVSMRQGTDAQRMVDGDAYTYQEAAAACRVSAETIRRRARSGKLRHGPAVAGTTPTVLMTRSEIEANTPARAAKAAGADDATAAVILALTEQTALLREQLGKAEDTAIRAERAAEQARQAGHQDRATAAEERKRLLSSLEGLVSEVTYMRAMQDRYIDAEPVRSTPRPGLLSRLIGSRERS